MRYALLLLLALPLAACGSHVSLNAVAEAATNASKAGSEHVTMTGMVTGGGQNIEMHGSGDFQAKPALGHMTMGVKTAGKTYAISEVLDNTQIYMQSPLLGPSLPNGKHWVTVDLQKAGKQLGVNFSQLESQSPSDMLASLEQVGSVKKIGTEVVDGVETTHYRATIDIAKNKALKQLEQFVSYHYKPVDVWIGKDGLPVRSTMTYVVENAGNAIQTAMTMDYSNYGEQVNVQVPSADETVDVTKLGGTG